MFRSITLGTLLKKKKGETAVRCGRNDGAEVSQAECCRACPSCSGRGRKHFAGTTAKLLFDFLLFSPDVFFFLLLLLIVSHEENVLDAKSLSFMLFICIMGNQGSVSAVKTQRCFPPSFFFLCTEFGA